MSCPITLYQLRSPFYSPTLKKTKSLSLSPLVPLQNIILFPFFSYHYISQKEVCACCYLRSSPHIHSPSHSHLASVSTPPLKLPSLVTNDPATPFRAHPTCSQLQQTLTSFLQFFSFLASQMTLSPTSLLLLRCLSQPFLATYQSSSEAYPAASFHSHFLGFYSSNFICSSGFHSHLEVILPISTINPTPLRNSKTPIFPK